MFMGERAYWKIGAGIAEHIPERKGFVVGLRPRGLGGSKTPRAERVECRTLVLSYDLATR